MRGVAGRAGPLLAALAVVGLLLVGVASKVPCTGGHTDARITSYQCYEDQSLLYVDRGLGLPVVPFGAAGPQFQAIEYPVVLVGYVQASAWLTHRVAGVDAAEEDRRRSLSFEETVHDPVVVDEGRTFFLVSSAGLVVAGAVALLLLRRLVGPRRWWRGMLLCAPPLVLLAAVNWDFLAVLCVVAALVAERRGRPGWAGVWIGLGAAAKLFPAVLLGWFLVVALRERRWSAVVVPSLAAAATWAVVNVGPALLDPDAWTTFWTLNNGRAADFGSVWMALRIVGHPVPHAVMMAGYVLGLLLALVVVLVVGTRSRRLDLPGAALVLVVGFLAGNPVFSPQYSLWLLPLVVVAVRSPWVIAAWSATATLYYVEIWLYIDGVTTPDVGVDKVYLAAILLRVLGELLLVAAVVRQAWERDPDPARSPQVESDVVLNRTAR